MARHRSRFGLVFTMRPNLNPVIVLCFAFLNVNHLVNPHSQGLICSHHPPDPTQINQITVDENHGPASGEMAQTEIDFIEVAQPTDLQNLERNQGDLKISANSRSFKRNVDNDKESIRSDNSLSRRHRELDVSEKEDIRLNLISPKFKSSHSSYSRYQNQEQASNRLSNSYIPMKISIYYDDSVNQLERAKTTLIKETIMPTVIRFFESALSIRREFTIDTFRISRRCANITYAKDNNGVPKPFCLNKCDDYSICGEMLVPPSHLAGCSYCNRTSKKCYTNHHSEGKGVSDTQLLIYVSAKLTQRCGREQTIAYAAHCAQDSKTDRPVAGHANLCPNSISSDPKDISSLIATVKHELTHVLGLSVSLFAYYRDQNGQPLTDRRQWASSNPGNHPPKDPKTGYPIWSDKIIRKVIRRGWVSGEGPVDKEVYLLVTPTVVREVRDHFNCSTLEGAELEDQGYDGTSMTHWEKRLFENEAMTGTHTHNSVYSRLTLAALQDTGWYVANFSVADRLYWGKNLGCEFATQSCKYWMDKRRLTNDSLDPFCDSIKSDSLQITCSSDHSAKAVCNMRKHKQPLAEFYRHFDDLDGVNKDDLSYYGGTVDLADYCPFVQEYTLQQHPITIRGSRCLHLANNLEADKNLALESFGPSSKCFVHGRRWTNNPCGVKHRGWPNHGAGCYRTLCLPGYVTITVNDYNYNCYYQGQEIEIIQEWRGTVYNGTIICPSCEVLCPGSGCKNYQKAIIDDILSDSRNLLAQVNQDHSGPIDGAHSPDLASYSWTFIESLMSKIIPNRSFSQRAKLYPDNITQDSGNIVDNTPISSNKLTPETSNLVSRWNHIMNWTTKSRNEFLPSMYDVEDHLRIYKVIQRELNQTYLTSSNLKTVSSQCSAGMSSRIPNSHNIFQCNLLALVILSLVYDIKTNLIDGAIRSSLASF